LSRQRDFNAKNSGDLGWVLLTMSGRRIVVLNPNSNELVTLSIDAALAPLKLAGGPEIECVTLRSGPAAIETDDDVAEVAPLVKKFVRKNSTIADAFVIACFSDPGLESARRSTRAPVFGIAECGYLTALTRGARFGVISILESAIPRHRRYIRTLGIESRLAGDLSLGLGVGELSQSDRVRESLIAVGETLKRNQGADVLVLGCAGLAGYRADFERVISVPVVEPVQAAVTMAAGTVLTTNN
jgi:Asp/Glu/hydantoin racemase